MASPRKTVVIGMLGTVLDAPTQRWRPSLSACMQPDLPVHRFELLHQPNDTLLAETVARDLRTASPRTEVLLRPVVSHDPWDFEAVYGALHDVARATRFDRAHEDYLVHITTGSHVTQICLFLLTESRYLPARLLQTAPTQRPRGWNPATKDKTPDPGRTTIIDLDLSRYDRIASRFRVEQHDAVTLLKSGIATRNTAYNQLIARVEQVAMVSRAPILLMGPTGSGKSQLARRIYELKRGRQLVTGERVDVNCATLRGDGAMSALFGHARGAFTGAQHERAGLLKRADGGLLFLDEIGELGIDEQTMLLRAIEEKTFLPMGSDREVQSDFQLVAGTNRDLSRDVASGRFREDLLARIDLWTFVLPGLAERREDLEPNLGYELENASRDRGLRVTMSKEAREAYLRFATAPTSAWSGNFRDLNASVTRMSTLATGGRIDRSLVDEEIARLQGQWLARHREPVAGTSRETLRTLLGEDAEADLDPFDRVQLAEVVRVCAASPTLSAAGRVLFERSRARRNSVNDSDRLRKYLARFDLDFETVRAQLAGV